MIMGEYFADAFGEMLRGRVIERILPELVLSANSTNHRSDHEEGLEHTVNTVQYSPPRLRVRLAALFHNLAELKGREPHQEISGAQIRLRESAPAAAKIMRRLRASRRQEQEVVSLLENQVPDRIEGWSNIEVRRFIARVGMDLLDDVLDLAYADRLAGRARNNVLRGLQSLQLRIRQELKRKPPLRIQDLSIDGRDVMRVLSIKPGPAVGAALRTLHREVLENPALNEPKILMDFLKKEYDMRFRLPSRPEGEKQTKGVREDKDAG
jgi:hypothetical protein